MSSLLQKIANNLLVKVPSNESVTVQSLWENNDVIFYFLRRFGCPVCRWISRNLSQIKPILDENNVKLVGIGPEQNGAVQFYDDKIFYGDIFVDESKKCYKDIGFGTVSLIGAVGSALDKATRDIANKAKQENLGGNFKGDFHQMGGVLIVKKGGQEILTKFVQKKPSDYIENKDILEALGIDAKLADKLGEMSTCNSDACGM